MCVKTRVSGAGCFSVVR